MKLIAVCGFEGSGKDSVANFISNMYDYKKISFASVLKDILAILFDWDRELLEGITEESRIWREQIDEWWAKELNISNFTPRYAMQYIATNVFRKHFHNDIWLLTVKRRLTKMDKVIITDARFMNEIEFIKMLGGTLIHIERELPDWVHRYKNGEDVEEIKTLHISQYEWIRANFDDVISNAGTKEDLDKNIYCWMCKFFGEEIANRKINNFT